MLKSQKFIFLAVEDESKKTRHFKEIITFLNFHSVHDKFRLDLIALK